MSRHSIIFLRGSTRYSLTSELTLNPSQKLFGKNDSDFGFYHLLLFLYSSLLVPSLDGSFIVSFASQDSEQVLSRDGTELCSKSFDGSVDDFFCNFVSDTTFLRMSNTGLLEEITVDLSMGGDCLTVGRSCQISPAGYVGCDVVNDVVYFLGGGGDVYSTPFSTLFDSCPIDISMATFVSDFKLSDSYSDLTHIDEDTLVTISNENELLSLQISDRTTSQSSGIFARRIKMINPVAGPPPVYLNGREPCVRRLSL